MLLSLHIWRLAPALLIIATLATTVSCTSSPRAGHSATVVSPKWSGNALVRVESGLARGAEGGADTLAWKGIAYAAPPVGELRWRAPNAPTTEDGVYEANRFGEQCVQYSPVIRGRVTGSEDCLYLNIWRPASILERLPVYVWIHGGGNSIGSANFVPDYYGHSLASKGNLVFVSVNHRLGPFGWLTDPAIRAQEDRADASGNFGTLDLIQALTWIKNNIESFGGDPTRVTIAGQSSGAINVLSLLVSELAAGLFHRAIVQSGAPNSSTVEAGDNASTALLSDEVEPRIRRRGLKDGEILTQRRY